MRYDCRDRIFLINRGQELTNFISTLFYTSIIRKICQVSPEYGEDTIRVYPLNSRAEHPRLKFEKQFASPVAFVIIPLVLPQ